MLFSLVFTSLPVAILGILDQDVDAKTSLAYPQLYRRGILGKEWTRWRFFGYMLDGLYQSVIAFGVPYFVFLWSTTHTTTGHDFALWELGTTVAACAVTAANLFVGLNIRYWTWMVFVVIIASTLAFHVWIAIYSQFETFFFANEVTCESELCFPLSDPAVLISSRALDLYGTAQFWFSIILVQIIAVGPKYLTKFIRSTYFPRDSDIVRELAVTGPRKTSQDVDLEQYAEVPVVSSADEAEDQSLVRKGGDRSIASRRQPTPRLGVVGETPGWVEPSLISPPLVSPALHSPALVSPALSPAPEYRSVETSPSLNTPSRFFDAPLTESDLFARSPLDAAHRQWRSEVGREDRTPSPAQGGSRSPREGLAASPLGSPHPPPSGAASPLHSSPTTTGYYSPPEEADPTTTTNGGDVGYAM